MKLGKGDLERATQQVQNIEDAQDLISDEADYFNANILRVKQSYHEESAPLIQSYIEASEQRQTEIKQQIKQKYTRMMDDVASRRNQYFASLDHMAKSLEEKKYGLVLASITHRSMMLGLFDSYCQGKRLFYANRRIVGSR